MAPKSGKLEAAIVVPTGGWDIACTDDIAGPTTVTMPAGTYYHSSVGSLTEDFADALATAINAAMAATWTVTVAAGENGTGKYAIGSDDTVCTVTFTDTDIRDVMGFTGNLSGSTGATGYTSPDQAEGIWLPGEPYENLNGGGTWRGVRKSDKQEGFTASGHYFGVRGASMVTMRLAWNQESRAKTWAVNEVTANESFEQFWRDAILGEAVWGAVGGPVRWYPDADTDATYGTYAVPGLEEFRPQQHTRGWVQLWAIEIPVLMEVPS